VSARRRPSAAAAQRQADAWAHPVGTPVVVRRDDGSKFETTTRSMPWVLGHGATVILVDGISGGYSLDRVSVRRAS
jgi:hypothetical protein